MKNSLLKCENYNTKFNYFSLLKAFWIGLKKVECRKCHSIYEQGPFNKILGGLAVIIAIFLSNILFLEDKNILSVLFVYIVTMFVFSLFVLFLMNFNLLK